MSNYFENKLTCNGVTFQLTDKSTPDEREIHTYHEILYFIEGEAELLTENSRRVLNNRSLLIIPRETYHFFKLFKSNFLRLKISIPEHLNPSIPLDSIMNSLSVTDRLSDGVSFVLNRLIRILQDEDSEKKPFYAFAAFLMLIEEIDVRADQSKGAALEQSGVAPKIIRYISENLSGDLSVGTIASAVNISSSGIIHSFKKELGISLHNYITQRRLIYARELIINGHQPSKIYTDCGYSDYSSFYRAYVKFFGRPPSKEKTDQT